MSHLNSGSDQPLNSTGNSSGPSNLEMPSINEGKTAKEIERRRIAAEVKRVINDLMASNTLSHEHRIALETCMVNLTNLGKIDSKSQNPRIIDHGAPRMPPGPRNNFDSFLFEC